MRGDVTVYSPKNVLCTMGIHIASGFTEDGLSPSLRRAMV